MPQQPNRPITVSDIVHGDPRVIELKKKFENYAKEKNEHIFNISHVEAGIIAKMGAFSYLNAFTETTEARTDLVKDFLSLSTAKADIIRAIQEIEGLMKKCEAEFKIVADTIVEDLKNMGKSLQSQMSAPECTCERQSAEPCTCNVKSLNGTTVTEPPEDTEVPGSEGAR
jgi:hypothetical protein